MRIIVISDSHKYKNNLYRIIERHSDKENFFIFLGDMDEDFDDALLLYPDIKYKRVSGNNEWGGSRHPFEQVADINGKKIFFCHGHTYGVKHGLEEIVTRARQEGADICLFGHTHIQYSDYLNGLYLFNPGASCLGYYGIIDITPGGIMVIPAKIN